MARVQVHDNEALKVQFDGSNVRSRVRVSLPIQEARLCLKPGNFRRLKSQVRTAPGMKAAD